VSRDGRRWRLLAAARGGAGVSWVEALLLYIQVDAVAVGLGVISCWCLLRAEDRRRGLECGAVRGLGGVDEANRGGPAPRPLLWLAGSGRTRLATAYFGRLLATGTLITAHLSRYLARGDMA